MKKSLAVLILFIAGAGVSAASTQITARVLGDRVNLRAKPELRSETVGQVNDGDMLDVKSVDGEWVEVAPPPGVDFWVHADFISGDRVGVKKLNVRSGPGVNYSVVGSFDRNDPVTRRGTFGDWVKIAPPSNGSLWISREFVDLKMPAPAVPPPVMAPQLPVRRVELPSRTDDAGGVDEPEEASTGFARDAGLGMPPVPVTVPPGRPDDLPLVPLEGQGRVVRMEGELKDSKYLLFKAPGQHRLIERNRNRIVTKAYLRGNIEQLDSMIGQRLIIQGREFWVEGEDVPLIVIELIERVAPQ